MDLTRLRARAPRSAALLIAVVAVCPPAADAATKRTKTVTYHAALKVDARMVTGPFSSTETVTGDHVAQPQGATTAPSAWKGEGPLQFGEITNTGLPQGCQLTTSPPTGTWTTEMTKAGESLQVTWSPTTTQASSGLITCQGFVAPFAGAPPVQPFLMLEPRTFTIPATGGTQQLSGRFDAGEGMAENTGTLTITRREECEPKVKEVRTYPPGGRTSLSSMAGRGFSPGEKLTADANVEFVFPDGSLMRLAKGSSYKETADCGAMEDKSRSFKGTLLLGKIWFNITKIFGNQSFEPKCPGRCIVGVRGTRFWTISKAASTTVSVSRGSVWFSRLTKAGRLTGPKVIVRAGRTATMGRTGKITLRRTKAADAFPFGAR